MPAFTALATTLGIGAAAGGSTAGAVGAAGAGGAASAAGGATSGVVGATGAGGAASGAGIAGGVGTALSIGGTALQVKGQLDASRAAKDAETLRQGQMNVEAERQKRQVIRQSLIARGEAMNTAAAQGATEGSGIAGGTAQIAAQANENIGAINTSQGFGNAMFGVNRRATNASTMASMGQGLSSLGGALFKNQEPIGRLSAYYGLT